MKLAEVVARVPTVRLAGAADNERILDFFEQEPMRTTGFAVQYRRRPDFFALLRCQGDRAHVLVSEDRAGRIQGVGTLSLRPAWIDGEPTTVGTFGDLRVRLDRNLAAQWRRLFGGLVAQAAEIDELADCTHWLTVVLDDNLPARRALAGGRGGLPRVERLAPFTMRNLLLRLPRRRRREPRWRVARAGESDRVALEAFFEEENRRLPFGFRGELERRLRCWPRLRLADFALGRDDSGIVACVAPWSPLEAKQTVVSRLPPALRALGKASSWLPVPPLRVPAAGEPVRALYLTHLVFAHRLDAAARRSVFRALLDHLFDGWKDPDWHCVALCDFAAWDLGAELRGFVQQTVPISVYAVSPAANGDGATAPNGAPAMSAVPPAFEMAMV